MCQIQIAYNVELTSVKELENNEAVNIVINLIKVLPEEESVTLADQTQIEAARAAYKNLTPEQQG